MFPFKKILFTALFVTHFASASEIVGGYSNSKVEGDSSNLNGYNLKFNYKLSKDGEWGGVISSTYTEKGGFKLLNSTIGGSYDLDKHIRLYALAGPSIASSALVERAKHKYGIASGLGLMIFDVSSPLLFDISYEHNDVREKSVHTFIFGVGYSF
ncbi:porin family protein [Enterobacter asburiae]|uniref:hypothetical protein n=1 Tax=Enterobacter asburiae TaxID=61645 RepID=UPI00192C4DD2|nr:hypothetical protein [Enterobacter asburiae]MBL5841316.1 hypothetical protein [Enterobacter asburiae]MBL5941709.1 hypothetical protein [Enterobacter asburiae]MBL5963537.1 hypothetical protein [Enterobacter asburiae]MBL5972108.1 hypothetical protein [Enterobacter asburiae]